MKERVVALRLREKSHRLGITKFRSSARNDFTEHITESAHTVHMTETKPFHMYLVLFKDEGDVLKS